MESSEPEYTSAGAADEGGAFGWDAGEGPTAESCAEAGAGGAGVSGETVSDSGDWPAAMAAAAAAAALADLSDSESSLELELDDESCLVPAGEVGAGEGGA